MAKKKISRIGIVTGGGDCPGLNAVIRAVAKTAICEHGIQVVGFLDGFEGMVENRTVDLDYDRVSGILTRGGTILGSSNRSDPFRYPMLEDGRTAFRDRSDQLMANVENLGLDCVVCLGGDGTMTVVNKLSEKGLKAVGIPKTIDNDLWGTDVTFGFNSAMTTAAEAIDKIHTTAESHHRVMIVEVMGRYAGWLALASGVAAGGDIILIPEIPYDIDAVCGKIKDRKYHGANFSILVIGEGAFPRGGEISVKKVVADSPEKIRLGGAGHHVSGLIEKALKVESRVIVLGHLVRGGVPTPYDRILSSRFGYEAMERVCRGKFGDVVVLKREEVTTIPIAEVAGKIRYVPLDSHLVKTARSIGTCLGD
jgi:6-phosphofructokinase 1